MLIYIGGVSYDTKKERKLRLVVALKRVYGMNDGRINLLCERLGLRRHTIVNKLSTPKIRTLNAFITKHFRTGYPLKEQVIKEMKLLFNSRTYRGRRHRAGLTVRGQRTKTNAQTVRRLKHIMGQPQSKTQSKIKPKKKPKAKAKVKPKAKPKAKKK